MSLAHPHSEFLVEDFRFVIMEDYGCNQTVFVTWVALIILYIPPVLLEIIAGVYGCLSIRAFYNRSNKTHINDFNFESNRYARLIFFSTCDLLCGIPITSFYLYIAITDLFPGPFPGLKEEHKNFFFINEVLTGIPITSFYLYVANTNLLPFHGLKEEYNNYFFIYKIPATVWRSTTLSELNHELNRWILVWGAFLFFAIFGFTEESRNNYRAILQSVVQVFVKITGIKSPSRPQASSNAEGCVIYIYILFFLFSV